MIYVLLGTIGVIDLFEPSTVVIGLAGTELRCLIGYITTTLFGFYIIGGPLTLLEYINPLLG